VTGALQKMATDGLLLRNILRLQKTTMEDHFFAN
jgi:hypothetical protein